jgi:hypothetical protein
MFYQHAIHKAATFSSHIGVNVLQTDPRQRLPVKIFPSRVQKVPESERQTHIFLYAFNPY